MPIEKYASKANSAFVPVEGPAPAAMSQGAGSHTAGAKNPYGASNEQFPERLQAALRRLV